VTLGGFELDFKPLPQKNPSNYKRYGRQEQTKIELPYVDVKDFGKVIIQLMDGDDPVCYHIEAIKNFVVDKKKAGAEKGKDGPAFKWVQFVPDLCVGKVTDAHAAGIFSFRMQIHDVTKDGPVDFKQWKVWKQKVAKRANPIKVRAYIYLCRDLPAADKEGTSDPFIRIWDTVPEEKKTAVIEDNTNPLYYEVVELDYEVENQ